MIIRRTRSARLVLLAILAGSALMGTPAEGQELNPPVLIFENVVGEPLTVLGSESSDTLTVDVAGDLDGDTIVDSDDPVISFGDWLGYNSPEGDLTWMADEQFGMFSIESYPHVDVGNDSAITFGTGFHFLNGPNNHAVESRLFDLQVAFHSRAKLSGRFMIDLKAAVGVFGDFEGSARDGVRFPSHVVSYFDVSPNFVSVFGIDVLDRDDISVLPVVGFVIRPSTDLVYELVFPRPRMRWRITSGHVLDLSAEIGGGTWAVERDHSIYDNFTYRDIRVMFGVMSAGDNTSLEVGWATDRTLEFRGLASDDHLDDALLFRIRTHY